MSSATWARSSEPWNVIGKRLALRPDHAETHNDLGVLLRKQGQLDQAAAHYQQALALRPDLAEAHNNLGNVLQDQGKFDEAAACYQRALAIKPDYAEAHNNLGNVLQDQGKFDEAAACYLAALALRPDYANAQLGVALCYLVQGDFQRGWPAYDVRLHMPGLQQQPNLPRWTGEPLSGRSLLLLAEQGFGDTFQFVRYARLLKARGARGSCWPSQPALGPLLASHPDVDELFHLGFGRGAAALRFLPSVAQCSRPRWARRSATIPWRSSLPLGRSEVDRRVA